MAKTSCEFNTSEQSTKAWFRTKGLIDTFNRILDLNEFRKQNAKWSNYARLKFGTTGNLFLETYGGKKAIPNREVFDKIDGSKYMEGLIGLNDRPVIKEGVEEVFQSNSEFANEVYEALGFKGRKENSYSVFSKIEKETKREDLKKIAKLLKNNSNSKVTSILFVDSNDSVMGMNHQSFKNNKINSVVRVLDETILSDFDKELLGNYTEETVLHEEIHRYTTIVTMLAEKYNNEELKELLNEKELKFLRELQDLHKIYKDNGGYFKLQEFITYGLTNEDE
ncbi:MAG: hypothetical protein E6R13_03530, partial [Spirochaetes bacterium]